MGVLFGTDGIRGVANQYPMDAMMAFSVGQAVTHVLKRDRHRTRIIIGKDTRISGYMLESAILAGITSMGGDPYLVGVLPTPGIAFITESMRADAGIVISASHNPYQDNGIKVFGGNGYKLSDEQEEVIERLILEGDLPRKVPPPHLMGQAFRITDVHGRLYCLPQEHFSPLPVHGGDEDRHRCGERSDLPDRPGNLHGAGRSSGCHPQYPQRDQHQRQVRLSVHPGPQERVSRAGQP